MRWEAEGKEETIWFLLFCSMAAIPVVTRLVVVRIGQAEAGDKVAELESHGAVECDVIKDVGRSKEEQ